MPPKKGDPKAAAKKGNTEEPKKGAKDDKKGGKDDKKGGKKPEEPPAKGKGKDDGKKGKGKKPVSESEEASEEEDESTSVFSESEESEEVVVSKKGDKGKGKAALKGASKAMAMKGMKPPTKSPSNNDDEGGQKGKKGMGAVNLKKMSDVNIKGASKAMMGFAVEGQKKSAAAAKAQKQADAKSHLKGASKALTGLAGKSSPFALPTKQQPEKAKPKRNLKSTSRLFLRLSKKKKPPTSAKPLLGNSKLFSGFGGKSSADKKPGLSGFSLFNKKDDAAKGTTPPQKTLNLSNLGAKGKMATEAKGLGGKFKGMFGKKKTGSALKDKSWMLGRIAAATNWLTGKFLTSKGHGRYGLRSGGRDRKRLSFAHRDARGRQTYYYNEAYEYGDDEYGYDEDYHDRLRPRGYPRQAYDPYDPHGVEMDYYDEEWEDEYGFYDDEGNFYYDDELYYDDDVDYYDYPYGYYDDEYEEYYGDEGMQYYYGEDGMLYVVEPEEYGFYDPYDAELYGDYYSMGYNYGITDPYGMMTGGYDVVPDIFNDPMIGYADPIAPYNPYQQPIYMDTGLDPAEAGQLYAQQQVSYSILPPETFSTEQFRFPRPQVKLFGKDRLEVETLPPPLPTHIPAQVFPPASPALALNNLEMVPDIHEQPLPTYLPPQTQYPTIINQQQNPTLPRQAPSPTAMIIQQENLSLSQPTHPALPLPPSHLSRSLSFPPESHMYQMGHMTPALQPIQPPMPHLMHSPLQSPMAAPRQVQQMSPFASPQLSQRPGSIRAIPPHSPHFSPLHMDFQTATHPVPYLSPRTTRRGPIQQVPMTGRRSASVLDRRRPPSPPVSPPYQRRGMSMRTQPSMTRGREGAGFRRSPSTVRPHSPFSSPPASPRGSLRKRASPPPSPRLSFRQQPPPDAVPLPSTRPHLFKGRKQTSKMRRSPSPPLPSPQRHSPPLPERSQSPPQAFRPPSPHRPSSPSPSRISSRPLPTRSSTRRMRGGVGGRSHVPMGAVKPSPANPYLQRRSRHGPPVTQHVAPFRSSIHSGPIPPSGGAAGAPALARTGSRPTGLRESKRIGTPQGGFHRPVGRGQPLVRMPRSQPSLQSRQSFRAPTQVPSIPTQPSLKQSGPPSPQPSVRRLQSRPLSPQPLHRSSPLLSRSASPMHHMSHPPSPSLQRAMSPHSLGQTSFQPPGTLPPPHPITQYDYTMIEPGPSPMLTNASPNSQVMGHFPPSPYPPSIPYSRPSSPLPQVPFSQQQNDIRLQNFTPSTPSSPYLGHPLQNPYLPNATNPLERSPSPIPGGQGDIPPNVQMSQEVSPYASLGLSNALNQNSRLRSASYSSPLQRNANLYTTVLAPPEVAAPLAPSVPSSPHLSSAMLSSQLRNASFASPLQRHLSPTSPAPPSATPQPGPIRGSSSFLSGGLQTSRIQASKFKLPGSTLTMSQGPVEPPVTADGGTGVSGGRGLSPSMLSNALQNPSLRQATYRLPDGSLVTRTEPTESISGPSPLSSSMLSSALLNPSLRQATYRLPDGSLVMRTEPVPVSSSSSPMLSSALLNPNVRKATYRLPDGTLVTRNEPTPESVTPSSSMLSSALQNRNVPTTSYRLPGSIFARPGDETQNSENAATSPGLSSALMNANLRKTKFQLPEGSSLFSRNQTPAPTSPLLSGAMLNTSLRGASYKLPDTSLFRQPGAADASESRSLDLSNALRNQNLRSATYRLPDGTLMTRPQPSTAPQKLDLSNALSKNPNLRGAKYRLPDGNIMTRLGAPSTPEPRSLNLSGALQNPNLRGASFRLPSYAVVSPQVQGSGPQQHWAQGPGLEGMQQDMDVWGSERILPHGTVQNLNKWSMYRDGELLEPHFIMGQGNVGPYQGEWNLSREGEPQGNWFDKVNVLNYP